MPCPRTIRSWYVKIDCEPGLCRESFNAIEMKVAESKQKNKTPLVCLSIDDMSLKEHVEYSGGKIIRYIDTGTEINNDNLSTAKMVCVIMCTAINDNWKVPCGYYFIDSLSGNESYFNVKLY